jgi:hypothetical protein
MSHDPFVLRRKKLSQRVTNSQQDQNCRAAGCQSLTNQQAKACVQIVRFPSRLSPQMSTPVVQNVPSGPRKGLRILSLGKLTVTSHYEPI